MCYSCLVNVFAYFSLTHLSIRAYCYDSQRLYFTPETPGFTSTSLILTSSATPRTVELPQITVIRLIYHNTSSYWYLALLSANTNLSLSLFASYQTVTEKYREWPTPGAGLIVGRDESSLKKNHAAICYRASIIIGKQKTSHFLPQLLKQRLVNVVM